MSHRPRRDRSIVKHPNELDLVVEDPNTSVPQPRINLRSGLLLLAFSIVLAVGLFILPWYLSNPAKPAAGQSFTYGYNNFAAQAWVALMLGTLLAYRFISKSSPANKTSFTASLPSIFPDGSRSSHNNNLFAAFLGVSIFTLALVGYWFLYLSHAYYGETYYFLSHLDLYLLGLSPYRDFHYNYGPALLYIPYFFYFISSHQLSIEQSYGITLLISWALGLYLIYYIISCLKGNLEKAKIFLLVTLPLINITLGLQYTPLRFFLPIATIIALHRLVSSAPKTGSKHLKKILIAAFLAPLLAFAISPEMGIASWLGCLAYFAHLWRTPLRRLSLGILPVALAFPATYLVFSPSYFDSLLAFGGGGSNFPIYPTVHIVFFLIAAFCVIPTLALVALKSTEPRGSLAIGLCIATGLLIVPALGRCDCGHILFNGIGILLLFLAGLSQSRSRLFKPTAVAYFLIFFVGNWIVVANHYSDAVREVFTLHDYLMKAGQSQTASNEIFHYSKMLPIAQEYQKLLKYKNIGTPIGCGEDLEHFLKLSGKFVPEYHTAPAMDVDRPSQLARKFSDMKSMEYILLPAGAAQSLGAINLDLQAKADSEFLSRLFLFPVTLHARNQPFEASRAIIAEIAKSYSVIDKCTDNYLILKRN